MKYTKSWYFAALAAIAVLGTAIPPAAAAPSTIETRGLIRTKLVREPATSTTSSTTFTNLHVTTIEIPAAIEAGIIRARFTAESGCSGNVDGSCSVRVLVNGVELLPAVSANYAFDSNNNTAQGPTNLEGHAVERSSKLLPAGIYEVRLQGRTSNAAITFSLDDWHLSLEVLEAL